MVEKIIIIGSGPAGLSAALYCARDDMKPIIISGVPAGGQLMLTTEVENFPGFENGIYGSKLIDSMRKQAEKFGAKFINSNVIDIDLNSKPFKIKTESQEFESYSVIIATGASSRWLGLESEKKFIGRGVSSCATCDGVFFKNKEVAIVGGGDTALNDALFLTRFVKKVTIIHRRNEFRASKIMQDRVHSNEKINIILNSIVTEVLGNEIVTGIMIKNNKTSEISQLNLEGVFVAIGYSPNTSFLKNKIELDEQKYIITKQDIKTNIEGVFAAGDVCDKIYKQAIIAAGSGAKAALETRFYLQKENLL